MKELKNIFFISVPITVTILLISYVLSGFDAAEAFSVESVGITFLYVFVLSLTNGIFYKITEENLNWKTQRKKRLTFGLIGSIVVSMLAYLFCRIVHLVFIEQKYTLVEFFEYERSANYVFTFLLVVIITLMIHLFYFYKTIQETKVKEQQIIAGTASAKFDALKSQLDPHFLFNSLNVLTSLIDENPDAAQKFTTSLSKVYRYVLEQKNKDLVSVEEELDFAKIYISLLKMRFENSILFDISEEISNPEAKIVPLSLQLLLENAVKHNAISEENPLIISIYEDDDILVIKNNLQHKNTLSRSNGIGLMNITQRYELLTTRKMQIYKDGSMFKVSLPMLTKQISVIPEKKSTSMKNIEYQKMKRARKRVEEIKGFYGNITSYGIIIPFLVFVNYFSNEFKFPWVLFPMIGWGIGILFHYMNTFGHHLFLGKKWEERKIKEYMEKGR